MLAILCKKATMHELSDKRKTILLVAIIYLWIGSMLGEYFNALIGWQRASPCRRRRRHQLNMCCITCFAWQRSEEN